MCTRTKESIPGRTGFTSLVWPLLVIALVMGSVFTSVRAAIAALPAPTSCHQDLGGKDQSAGGTNDQGDLTQFCLAAGTTPYDFYASWSWDDSNFGSQTGDGCLLFDKNNNGRVDYAVCATVTQQGQFVGRKLYACNDSRPENCGQAQDITTLNTKTTCETSVKSNDPFKTNPQQKDTVAVCGVAFADFGATGQLTLIDACSYSSSSPSSNARDCILFTPCSANTACNDNNSCTTDTCDLSVGACRFASNTGTSCGAGATACSAQDTCDYSGFCQANDLPVGMACTADSNECTKDECDGAGACTHPAQPDGASCNDGNACTQTDTCQNGTCTGSNPVVCTASDQCHEAGTCNQATGVCSNPVAANGASCNDGNACTQTDTCQNGTCTGSPVVCTASDQCHVAGVCDPSSGACLNPAARDGTSCNDNNACTQGDTCQSGTCTSGTPKVCPTSDPCHDPGMCNTTTGVCSNPPSANTRSCNDDNACTQTDKCNGAGDCVGSNPVVCAALDQCHTAGTCASSTGVCSNPVKTDGSSCADGISCTLNDTCQSGLCTGGNGPSSDPGCKKDIGRADDAVGQKDLTNFCLSPGGASCAGTSLTWQWDDTAWSGSNTGDACALYDTDGDKLVNFALCVTVTGSNPVTQAAQSPRLYSCTNTKEFNCTGATLVTGRQSSCFGVQSVLDPFAGVTGRKANTCSGKDCLTKDTQVQCCVQTVDLPTTASLIDVCSYPSQSPSSDPSECVKTVFCTGDGDCLVTSPDQGEGQCQGKCQSVGGVNQCVY